MDPAGSGRQLQPGRGLGSGWWQEGGDGAGPVESKGASRSPPGLGHRGLEAWGEMAARSLGCGVWRLLDSLPGHAGPRGWPPPGVSALRRAASGPSGSVPAAGVQPASYPMLRVQAAQQPAAFWGPLARETLLWDTPYHTVWDCDFSSGKIAWFLGGQLNVSGEWAAGTQGAPNSHLQGGLTEPGRRSSPRRIAASWATSTPAPEAPAFPPAATPSPTPPCPLQPLPTETWPGVSWSRQLLAWLQGLLQWWALKFNHVAPPPRGAQACAEQRGTPGPGWGGVCRAPGSRDFSAPISQAGGKTEKHLAIVNTSCLSSDWPGKK